MCEVKFRNNGFFNDELKSNFFLNIPFLIFFKKIIKLINP